MKILASFFFILIAATSADLRSQTIFFKETFEDTLFDSRGWYDNTPMKITTAEHIPGSSHSVVFHFKLGALTADGGVRHLFPESDEVYLSYWVKYSANWTGSNKPYHPHDFHFVTNENDKWVGPAYTHLTTYTEENEGTPLMAIQDGENVDENHIGEDLTNITENRSLAGCNGDADGTGVQDCYLNGGKHWNGKVWKSKMKYFSDSPGKYYKNDWHFIEASFKMNDIVGGKGIANGAVMMWYDGELIINEPKVMLRTGQFPNMKFNQFLIAPYIGDGSPIDQTMWVDDMTVASARPASTFVKPESLIPKLKVYPNPFTDHVTFEYNSDTKATLEIFDELGRELINPLEFSPTQRSTTLEHLGSNSSLYYKLNTGGKTFTGLATPLK